jgi:flagellum-specific peptidoglycan hydrolase FlgJ
MFKKILLLFIAIIFIGCNASKTAAVTKNNTKSKSVRSHNSNTTASTRSKQYSPANQNKNRNESKAIVSNSNSMSTNDIVTMYVSQFKYIAIGNMRTYGIPASIILAQGILESGAGRSNLAARSNNHFGIKCHVGWTGESVSHDDDSAQECFRKYNNPSESFKDHSLFLTGRSRYAKLFSLSKGDYKAWAKGLREAGYATDPKYPDKLISYIERYNLHQYDAMALDKNYTYNENESTKEFNVETASGYSNLISYVVQKGDTLYSISKKFQLQVDYLKQKNNLSDNTLSIGQKLVVQ